MTNKTPKDIIEEIVEESLNEWKVENGMTIREMVKSALLKLQKKYEDAVPREGNIEHWQDETYEYTTALVRPGYILNKREFALEGWEVTGAILEGEYTRFNLKKKLNLSK